MDPTDGTPAEYALPGSRPCSALLMNAKMYNPDNAVRQPRPTVLFALAAPLALISLFAAVPVFAASSSPHSDFQKNAVTFLEKHCVECHGGKKTKADLNLKKIERADDAILKNRKVWLNVINQVTSGEMPPKKQPRPDLAEIEKFAQSVESAFDRAEAKMKPDPGRVTVRRLNRNEYNNTIRDLLSVDFNPAEDFPADDIGHGFDNIGDVLTLSPVLMERYLSAAESIADRAVVFEAAKPPNRTTTSNFLEPAGHEFGSSLRPAVMGYFRTRSKVTLDGEYIFRVRAAATNAPNGEPVRMVMLMNEKELLTVTVTNSPKKWEAHEVKLNLPPGEHAFSIKYLNPVTSGETNRMLFVEQFQVIGPTDTRPVFQQRISAKFGSKPKAVQNRELATWFVTRAFRRPPTPVEVDRYVKVIETGEAEGGKWEAGVQLLLKTVLCSPKFLFRIELDDRPQTKQPHPLDEFQLAARLSYFLWSTMPDDELFALAEKKQLTASLDAQVKRMLKDHRADALVQNFALQWLQVKRLQTSAPDPKLFPQFDERLRRAMLRETELFFGEIMREDRSVMDLIDGDFTYLNEPLARLYGIADTAGNRLYEKKTQEGGQSIPRNEFVRVSLPLKERGGLLTQASVLTVTSNPTRTSPVKRGKWILEQILGTPPPPPPPNVPELDAQKKLSGTLRQRMEQHRENPSCASCHAQMDAMGFAMENFNAIGAWRAKDGGDTIDPSGSLPDGKSFKGAGELKAVLKEKKELFVRNFTEKMLTYSLGRGLEYYDNRAIRQISTELARQDYKFSVLVSGIVKSDPFRLRRGKELNDQQAAK
jgi:mono/diheme cytochrome c family protein